MTGSENKNVLLAEMIDNATSRGYDFLMDILVEITTSSTFHSTISLKKNQASNDLRTINGDLLISTKIG